MELLSGLRWGEIILTGLRIVCLAIGATQEMGECFRNIFLLLLPCMDKAATERESV